MNPMNIGRKIKWTSRGIDRIGYFHEWVVLSDHVYAIVENPDGTIVVVRMQSMRFVNEEYGGCADVSNETIAEGE